MRALQAPGVRFAPGFLRRVEAFAPRLAAARERREGAGGARLDGAGLEFVGRRPYRPGDDPRLIDWELLAREERPWVRVLHREAAERWAIVVDVSGSMGVGPPGKLQSAAEVAVAVAAVAVRGRAVVSLHLTGPAVARVAAANAAVGGAPLSGATSVTLRRPGDIARATQLLGAARADGGAPGLAELARRQVVPNDAGRVVLLGDLWDLSPADIGRLARPGRELFVGRVSAPCELDPEDLALRAARFVDPEGQAEVLAAAEVRLDPSTVTAYRRALEEELERFAQGLARRRVRYHAWRSDAPFEEPARALLEG